MSDDRCIGMELEQGGPPSLARVRHEALAPQELARRYGVKGRRAPDALDAEAIYAELERAAFQATPAVIADELGGNLSALPGNGPGSTCAGRRTTTGGRASPTSSCAATSRCIYRRLTA